MYLQESGVCWILVPDHREQSMRPGCLSIKWPLVSWEVPIPRDTPTSSSVVILKTVLRWLDNVFNGGFVGAKEEAVIHIYKDDAIILDEEAFFYLALVKSYVKEIFSQMFVSNLPFLL